MRRRLTRRQRMASAPPAIPGYDVDTDPDIDEYGIDSDFGSEPHQGPYLSGPPPATPGYKSASRQIRASMERKASKCIRIAQAMLGDVSTSEIEDQALDLMDLSDRQIQASLARVAESFMMAEHHEGMYEEDDMLDMMAEDMDIEAAKPWGIVNSWKGEGRSPITGLPYGKGTSDKKKYFRDYYDWAVNGGNNPAVGYQKKKAMYEEDDMLLDMMAEEDLLESMMDEEAMGKYAKEEEEEEEEEAKEKKASLDPMGLNFGDDDYNPLFKLGFGLTY